MSTEQAAGRVRAVLESFLADLGDRLSPHDLEAVLRDGDRSLTSAALGNSPESFTENALIFPLLEAVGLESAAEPYGEAGGHGAWPDFEVENLGVHVIGESKKPNHVESAIPELKDYLDRKSIGADYGVATDGVTWVVYKIELGGDFTAYPEIARLSLRDALLDVARQEGHVGQAAAGEGDADEEIAAFVDLFERAAFDERLTRTEPRRLRDERKRDVEEFYDLYIELLFGEGEQFSYDTCLVDDVQSPRGATRHDEQLFAITLVNRLLFVKFLETRGVLAEGFLRERVDYYEEHGEELGGTLYETQFVPLFYDLLNTPTGTGERKPKYRDEDSWFASVPYLNGGLFRESIEDERRYGVYDRTLEQVVTDLIEGSRLELNGRGFDPAIVGSVFEKTINHIEQERTQKDIGAYYTPNDVTEIIVRESVDPKIADVLVEAAVENAAGDDDLETEYVRRAVESMDLAEMLQEAEDGRGYFGNAAVVEAALADLADLKVVDPACGSGHFLTTAMDELHRVQLSLLRGLNGGEDPDPAERYAAKQELALNAVYGVDVDEVATEIAKLRVWLKIVEGNGWKPRYGQLPNVDVNITDGNSLVGLPMTGTFDDVDVWSEDIAEIERRRLRYKEADEGDPRDLERFMDAEIRPALDEQFLEMFTQPVETELRTVESFDRVVDTIEDGNLYPTVSMVRVRRDDGEAFDDEAVERLEAVGFDVHHARKSGKLDVQERESTLKRMDGVDHWERLTGDLRGLLADGFAFTEVQRQPTRADLDDVLGKPFHWVAEFPEVASTNGGRHSIDFDIMLANPPYGDLLSEAEKMMTNSFTTNGLNEISFNFVERQLQFISEGGYYGNITSQRFVYQSDAYPVHDILREQLEDVKIASFGHRPRSIFGNAQARTAIVTGSKSNSGEDQIYTSELVLFEESNREEQIFGVEYASVEGLLLRERMGAAERENYEILPKVGRNRDLLLKLQRKSDRTLGDVAVDQETEYPNYRKRGGGYWLGFAPINEWGDLTSIQPLYYDSELTQKAAFLLVNSSLFYVYWTTYSNFRNFDFGHINKFPVPEQAVLAEYEDEIYHYADLLWQGMLDNPSNKSDERFDMGGVKPILDEIEETLIAEWFDLTDEQTEYLQDYHTNYGRSES